MSTESAPSPPVNRRRAVRRTALVVAAAAALVAVVAVPFVVFGGSAAQQQPSPLAQPAQPSTTPAPALENDVKPALKNRADQVIDRWAQTLARGGSGQGRRLVLTGPTTTVTGTWDGATADNAKVAAGAGQFVIADDARLPPTPATPAEVRWTDGVTTSVPVLGAAAAMQAVRDAGSDCQGCTPLTVTAASLGRADVETAHGRASVPVWRYRLAGTEATVTVAAVAPPASVQVPELAGPEPTSEDGALVAVEGWSVGADNRTLTLHFIGAGSTAAQGPCGGDYAGGVVETTTGVVPIVWRVARPAEQNQPSTEVVCTMVGYPRSVQVALESPLADRTVLSLQSGMPVPQRSAP